MRLRAAMFLIADFLIAGVGAAQIQAPVKLVSPVQDKNFYLLSILERTAAVRDAVKADAALARLATERLRAMDDAAKSCKADTACYAAALEWNDTQSAEAGKALAGLYAGSAAVREFVDGPLRESGMYVRYNKLAGDELLEHAWTDCIRAVNRMIEVYGLGKAPRYPAIDSPTYDVKSANWHSVVQSLVAVLEENREGEAMFFQPAMKFALEVMLLNQRDEAGRLEPMEAGENAAAVAHMRSVRWERFEYSVIVVPGAGNDRPGVRLSPGGQLRDEIAAKRYREGKAPFVLVSGGYVHPERTEYCEALEMKRDLMTRFGIPAEAILVDPHARHTTTNMRNAARLMYRYGMPFDKKALVSTDLSQSAYIENPLFGKRNMEELGYVPYQLLGRTSPFDLEFVPTLDSLQSDATDPLDP